MITTSLDWRRPVLTWAALCLLGLLSLALSRLALGGAFLAIALCIAAAQGAIAARYFMGLGEVRSSIGLVPFAVIFFMALMIGLVALDVATRTTFPMTPTPELEELGPPQAK